MRTLRWGVQTEQRGVYHNDEEGMINANVEAYEKDHSHIKYLPRS